ncbi:MAG: hypothetical protein R6U98_12685 [Pirellulaceae bacterium]
MESCPTPAVLPSAGLAADTVIRDRYIIVCGLDKLVDWRASDDRS